MFLYWNLKKKLPPTYLQEPSRSVRSYKKEKRKNINERSCIEIFKKKPLPTYFQELSRSVRSYKKEKRKKVNERSCI